MCKLSRGNKCNILVVIVKRNVELKSTLYRISIVLQNVII